MTERQAQTLICKTDEHLALWNEASGNPTDSYVGDYANPLFVLANAPTELVKAIVDGRVDIKLIARRELQNRGVR